MCGVFEEATRAAETGEDKNRGAVLEDPEWSEIRAQKACRELCSLSARRTSRSAEETEEEDFRSVQNRRGARERGDEGDVVLDQQGRAIPILDKAETSGAKDTASGSARDDDVLGDVEEILQSNVRCCSCGMTKTRCQRMKARHRHEEKLRTRVHLWHMQGKEREEDGGKFGGSQGRALQESPRVVGTADTAGHPVGSDTPRWAVDGSRRRR